MAAQSVTVFGGTGFRGRCIARHLQAAGFGVRAASRHPDRGRSQSAAPGVEPVRADINDESSVAAAVAGASGSHQRSQPLRRARERYVSIRARRSRRSSGDDRHPCRREKARAYLGYRRGRRLGLSLHPQPRAGGGCGSTGVSVRYLAPAGRHVWPRGCFPCTPPVDVATATEDPPPPPVVDPPRH